MSSGLKDVARSYFKAYETGSIEAVMAFLDHEYVLHPGGVDEALSYEGRMRDEMVFFAAFSNIEALIEDQVAEGDQVVSRVTFHCTHSGEYQGVPATGKRVTITYMDILRIRAGKIVEEWVEFDMMSILRQIRS